MQETMDDCYLRLRIELLSSVMAEERFAGWWAEGIPHDQASQIQSRSLWARGFLVNRCVVSKAQLVLRYLKRLCSAVSGD